MAFTAAIMVECGKHVLWVFSVVELYRRTPSQQQQGFIHHLVSYTVTDSRETGYGIMIMSSSAEYFLLVV